MVFLTPWLIVVAITELNFFCQKVQCLLYHEAKSFTLLVISSNVQIGKNGQLEFMEKCFSLGKWGCARTLHVLTACFSSRGLRKASLPQGYLPHEAVGRPLKVGLCPEI